MYVSLTLDGRWRRRYLSLYPTSGDSNTEGININEDREINRPQILIFPRQSAKMATARIRLTSSHGIQNDNGTFYGYDKNESWKNSISFDNNEEGGKRLLTFKLVKRNKITLYMKVSLSYFYTLQILKKLIFRQ